MPSTFTSRLEGLTTSVAVKAPCRVATTAAITLSGLQTIDGVALSAGDRVLVKSQSSAVDNGIWIASVGSWTRAADFDGTLDAVGGTQAMVLAGAVSGNTYWRVDGVGDVDIGQDGVTFEAALINDSATQTFLASGALSEPRSVQNKLRDIRDSRDAGIISDDATDQTGEIVAWLGDLPAEFRGTVYIAPNTVFDLAEVAAAVPDGAAVVVDNGNFGQGGYKTTHHMTILGESVSDDKPYTLVSGHHPTIILCNLGTSGSESGDYRYASIIQGLGVSAIGDIAVGLQWQFGKSPGENKWRAGLVLYRDYFIGLANPADYEIGTTYATHNPSAPETANTMCVSDSDKVYKCTSGGVASGSGPTGTGTGIVCGGATFDYYASAVDAQSTLWQVNEDGRMVSQGRAGVSARYTLQAAGRTMYFDIDPTSQDVVWYDQSRGLDIWRVSTAGGLVAGIGQSKNYLAMNGANPEMPATGAGYTSDATSLETITLPTGRTRAEVTVHIRSAKTIVNGSGTRALRLKGATNASAPDDSEMVFRIDTALSGAWREVSRSF